MPKSLRLLVLSVLVVVSACQSNLTETPLDVTTSPNAEPLSTLESPTRDIPMTSSPATPANASMQNVIDKAKDDLAQRLSVASEEINLIEATEMEWSDSSLECPQPGMEYLQVVTPGYRILLSTGGNTYEYHSNRDSYVVFCEN